MKWVESTLADVCDSVRYGYTASASEDDIGPKFLRITDVVPDIMNWDTVPYCEADEQAVKRYALQEGDIVVARTGATVGYAKMIKGPVDAVFASYLVRFRVDPDLAEPCFVGQCVQSSLYKAYVHSRIGGAAQPNANAKVLGAFKLRLPSRSEQQRIASILSAYDDRLEQELQKHGASHCDLHLPPGVPQQFDFAFTFADKTTAVEVEKTNREKLLRDVLKSHMYLHAGADFAVVGLPKNYPHTRGMWNPYDFGVQRFSEYRQYGFGTPDRLNRILLLGFEQFDAHTDRPLDVAWRKRVREEAA